MRYKDSKDYLWFNAERRRAALLLLERPSGSVRKWADLLGWTPARMQRFLRSLARYDLAKVHNLGGYGTVVEFDTEIIDMLKSPDTAHPITDTPQRITDTVRAITDTGRSITDTKRDRSATPDRTLEPSADKPNDGTHLHRLK